MGSPIQTHDEISLVLDHHRINRLQDVRRRRCGSCHRQRLRHVQGRLRRRRRPQGCVPLHCWTSPPPGCHGGYGSKGLLCWRRGPVQEGYPISQVKRDPELQSASVAIMSQDIFYVELNQTQMEQAHQGNFNFDHPNAFDFDLFEEILRKLASGDETVQVPTYSYKTHSRTGWEDFHNADVIIVEGILVLYHKAIRDMFEMKIFVDCDSDTRLARRVFRDIEERGRSVENVLHQYCEHVKPAFEEFCRPTKKYVDVILPRGRENTVAVNLIAQHIRDVLKQDNLIMNVIYE